MKRSTVIEMGTCDRTGLCAALLAALCTVFPARADEPPPAVPDLVAWNRLCAQPGVFVCDDFSSAGRLSGTLNAGDAIPYLDAGQLVFEIPAHSGDNAGGDYRVAFPAIGEGGFLAFAYAVKADAGAVELPGRKEFILWRGASSCTDLELAQTHYYEHPVVIPYSECGSRAFWVPMGQYDYLFHYPDYHCTLHGIHPPYEGCAITHVDQWENFYIEVALGHYGQADSRVVMWHRTGDGAWKRYIERDDFTFHGNGGFDQFMLTVYMTGKDPNKETPPGQVVYDYLVLATQPFGPQRLPVAR